MELNNFIDKEDIDEEDLTDKSESSDNDSQSDKSESEEDSDKKSKSNKKGIPPSIRKTEIPRIALVKQRKNKK